MTTIELLNDDKQDSNTEPNNSNEFDYIFTIINKFTIPKEEAKDLINKNKLSSLIRD